MARQIFIVSLWFFSVLLACASNNSLAVVEINEFSSGEIRARYDGLIEELRCPKCQNQNLAGSDSAVSVDLRREVLIMLENGSTDEEIKSFMRDRYGDFILYQPPVEGKTLLVWALPVVFLLFAAVVAFFVIRNATRNARLGLDDDYFDTDADDGFDSGFSSGFNSEPDANETSQVGRDAQNNSPNKGNNH